MNVSELIDRLQEMDGDAEVRFMSQPSWPFEYGIAGTWQPNPMGNECGECGYPSDHPLHNPGADDDGGHSFEGAEDFVPEGGVKAVYLVEGSQLAYGTKTAWEEVER